MLLGLVFPVPAESFLPHPDFYPDLVKLPDLLYCGRFYPCGCGVRTGWRYCVDNLMCCICSTECLEALLKGEIQTLTPVEAPVVVATPEVTVNPIPPDVAA